MKYLIQLVVIVGTFAFEAESPVSGTLHDGRTISIQMLNQFITL